ncbi:MAG: hypothetical protein WCJ14_11520 [Verrucomicrobiota bacterium]
MSAPSEPEKYSIEEMMERLQSHPPEGLNEDCELVTREDGSQALRVRKRKRRSQQPHKEQRLHTRRTRMIQVSTALILLLLGIFLAGVAIVYANSTPFREKILRHIALSTGANGELEQFRVNPTSANAARVSLTWPEGNALQNLTLNSVKAEISLSSFYGQALTGEDLTAAEGTLLLRVCPADQSPRYASAPVENPPIRFDRYAITKAQLLLGDPAAPLIRLRNAEVSFSPVTLNDHAQLLLSGGEVTIHGWPKLRMDRSHIEFRDSAIDIVGMRLRHETDSRGLFELNGSVTPYASERASTLAVHLESYLLAGIVGPELGRLFSGRIDTLPEDQSNSLAFSLGQDPTASLALVFHNAPADSIELNGFPFLFGLSQTIGDDWFEHPLFDNDVSGAIHRADGRVTIRDLNFETKGRLAVRGALTMAADKSLSGQLEVGVATAMIKAAKSRHLDTLFGPPSESFRWLTLTIGGTASAPTDNFKQLFQASKPAKSPPAGGEIPSFEELTAPK